MSNQNEKIFMKKFGEKVKLYRNMAKLTQEQLAEKCGCSPQTISGTETGYSFPSSKILFKLADELNIPVAYLFNFGDDKNLETNALSSLVIETFENLNDTQQKVMLKIMQELS